MPAIGPQAQPREAMVTVCLMGEAALSVAGNRRRAKTSPTMQIRAPKAPPFATRLQHPPLER
eukprot:15344719-Alexandrium_andersonii.AAC.1